MCPAMEVCTSSPGTQLTNLGQVSLLMTVQVRRAVDLSADRKKIAV